MPSFSKPWPMILTPQWAHDGASAWMAHSKLSKVWVLTQAGPTDHGGFPLDIKLPVARQRPCLRTCLHVPGDDGPTSTICRPPIKQRFLASVRRLARDGVHPLRGRLFGKSWLFCGTLASKRHSGIRQNLNGWPKVQLLTTRRSF